jgi:hypothetical protein
MFLEPFVGIEKEVLLAPQHLANACRITLASSALARAGVIA